MTTTAEKTRAMITAQGITGALNYLYFLYLETHDLSDDFNEWMQSDPVASAITNEIMKDTGWDE